jgi:hypothetical protein
MMKEIQSMLINGKAKFSSSIGEKSNFTMKTYIHNQQAESNELVSKS